MLMKAFLLTVTTPKTSMAGSKTTSFNRKDIDSNDCFSSVVGGVIISLVLGAMNGVEGVCKNPIDTIGSDERSDFDAAHFTSITVSSFDTYLFKPRKYTP